MRLLLHRLLHPHLRRSKLRLRLPLHPRQNQRLRPRQRGLCLQKR